MGRGVPRRGPEPGPEIAWSPLSAHGYGTVLWHSAGGSVKVREHRGGTGRRSDRARSRRCETRWTTGTGWSWRSPRPAGGALGEVPIGAVIVRGGEVVGRGHNRREIDGDPLAHAELLAIRRGRGARSAAGGWSAARCT